MEPKSICHVYFTYHRHAYIILFPQEPVVFSGNLRENLDPYSRHVDDDIWNALQQAHLRSFIKEREQGLEFECGEDGKNMR